MIKRRKDGGFTLIELMIVIAVIGILAVVLVPKMSGLKDSAKESGVVTNAKSVEAYVIANIDRWQRDSDLSAVTDIESLIESKFRNGDDTLENPIGGTKAIDAGSDPTAEKGAIIAKITMNATTNRVEEVVINAYGDGTSADDIIYTKTLKAN